MNVANQVVAPVATTTGVINGQAAATAQPTTLAGLFAVEMGAALQGLVEQGVELPAFADGMSDEDLQALTDLMALIQQLLSGVEPQQAMQVTEEDSASTQEEAIASLQQLLGKFSTQIDGQAMTKILTSDQEKMIKAFVEQGFTQEEAETFSNLLLTLAKTPSGKSEAKVDTLVKQANQLLETLGIDSLPEEKPVKNPNALLQRHAASTVFVSGLNSGNQDSKTAATVQSTQSLQVNQVLSKYQVEAGLTSQARVTTGQVSNVENVLAQQSNESEQQPMTVQAFSTTVQSQPTTETPGNAGIKTVVHADRFAQEMSDVFVKQMKLESFKGFSEAKITLNPESLGQVDVKLTLQNGVLTAHFTAETRAGKELLDNQMGHLRAALLNQGLQVDRLEVSQPQQSQDTAFAFQQQREQARQQQNEQQRQQTEDTEQPEFSLETLVDNVSDTGQLRRGRNVEYSV